MTLKPILTLSAILMVAACSGRDKASEVDESLRIGELGAVETLSEVPSSSLYDEVALDGPSAGTQEELVANVGDRVYFGYDRHDLTPEARAQIESQANWLKQNQGISVTVEGHADERGTREYNLALGERRATAVRNYLIALGVEPGRVGTISYGKERPVALGSNPQAWAQNRRGVMVVN